MASLSIVYPVHGTAAVSEFLVDQGLTQRFVDGDKFAMLEADGLRVMVVAGSDRIVEHPSLAFQIDGDAAAELLKQHPDAEVIEGDHERNIVITDPSGNTVVFFARKPKEEER